MALFTASQQLLLVCLSSGEGHDAVEIHLPTPCGWTEKIDKRARTHLGSDNYMRLYAHRGYQTTDTLIMERLRVNTMLSCMFGLQASIFYICICMLSFLRKCIFPVLRFPGIRMQELQRKISGEGCFMHMYSHTHMHTYSTLSVHMHLNVYIQRSFARICICGCSFVHPAVFTYYAPTCAHLYFGNPLCLFSYEPMSMQTCVDVCVAYI